MSSTGRADKVRVERRLMTARRGARLLDRKQHILADELERFQLRAELSRAEWEELATEAAVWLRRSAALDGSGPLEEVAPSEAAVVRLRWGNAMGISYPDDPECRLPRRPRQGEARPCPTRLPSIAARWKPGSGMPRCSVRNCCWLPSSRRPGPGSARSKTAGFRGWRTNCGDPAAA